MKILLSYSKYHFNPEENSNKCTSAGILAEALYNLLSKFGDITYIEGYEPNLVGKQEFDLFVGISNNFCKILKKIKCKKSILFAVNQHPEIRIKNLKKVMKEFKIPKSAFLDHDFPPKDYKKAIEVANNIICVGNSVTRSSYIKNGVKPGKIEMINYGLPWDNNIKITPKNSGQKHFIYIATDIALRKGFDIVYDIFSNKNLQNNDFTLTVLGNLDNHFYKQKMESLQNIIGEKLKFEGWIDSTSDKYNEIINNNDFIVFPSIEEGQAGTILDCVSKGLIPVLSPNCGFDFSPLGVLDFHKNSKNNIKIIQNCLDLNNEEITKLKEKTLEYYFKNHHEFKDKLSEIIEKHVSNMIQYPKQKTAKNNELKSYFYKIICKIIGYNNISGKET